MLGAAARATTTNSTPRQGWAGKLRSCGTYPSHPLVSRDGARGGNPNAHVPILRRGAGFQQRLVEAAAVRHCSSPSSAAVSSGEITSGARALRFGRLSASAVATLVTRSSTGTDSARALSV